MPLISLKPDVVIPEIAFPEFVFQRLNLYKDKVAVIDAATGQEHTFGFIFDQSIKMASALTRLGLKRGEVVATSTVNSIEYFVTMLAVTACGAIISASNPKYTVGEIMHQFSHCEPAMIFCYPGNYKKIKELSSKLASVKEIITIGEVSGVKSYKTLLQNETGTAFPQVEFDVHEDVAFLPYSSGTTGPPKGVMLTHYNCVAMLQIANVDFGFPTDCLYSCLPLFHSAGLVAGFSVMTRGVKHVLDTRFNIKNMFACIEKYKVTEITGVPPILIAMAKSPLLNKYDLSSLRSVSSRGAPLSPDIAKILSDKSGCYITQGWGLTEALKLATGNSLFAPFNSVGIVTSNTKLKVIDVATGKELGPNKNGEFCIKGPQMMKGYYKNPKATSDTIDSDGWMHTGDIGHFDDNEMIFIVDRLKELIKYKGFQVAPAEVESVLLSHSGIADAAVVGIPHAISGEVAKGFVVKKNATLTEREIHEYMKDKLIRYKHLHGGIEFCDSIPKTSSGKILRRNLKKHIAKSKL